MSKKILIECPICGRINEASTSFFARRQISCACGHIIDVKREKLATKKCPKCGNLIVFNKSKKQELICPVCHEPLNNPQDDWKNVEIVCPECSCHIISNKDDQFINCPICGAYIFTDDAIKTQQYKDSKQPLLLKSDMPNDICVWKHPVEDFAFGSQIIVNDSQVAIFVQDGAILGEFEKGRHVIDKDTLVLSKDNFMSNGVLFHSQLYFISKTLQLNQKWGTDSKIRLFDPVSGLHVELGACGTLTYKIVDYVKFLKEIVGIGSINANGVRFDEILFKIRPNIVGIIKSEIAKNIRLLGINILEIDEYTKQLGDSLLVEINQKVKMLGIELIDFVINNIMLPDDDPNFNKMKNQYAERYLNITDEQIKKSTAEQAHDRIMVEINTENEIEIAKAKAQAEVERIKAQGASDAYVYQAQAEAAEMKLKGYTYQDETHRQVSNAAAEVLNSSETNGSLGGIASEVIKYNMVSSIGKNIVEELSVNHDMDGNGAINVGNWDCPNCGLTNIKSKYCPNCGARKPNDTWDCQKCGTKNIKTKYCPNCGNERNN